MANATVSLALSTAHPYVLSHYLALAPSLCPISLAIPSSPYHRCNPYTLGHYNCYSPRFTFVVEIPLITKCEQAAVEVEAIEPTHPALKATLASMADRGIQYVYGRWLIDGAPRVLLFDTGTGYKHLDEWKADLWSTAGIPCPPGDSETNEAIVFGYLVAWFLGEV